jgi:hypothetical protein
MAAALSIEGGRGGFSQYPGTGARHKPCPLAGLRYDCGDGLVRKRPFSLKEGDKALRMLENKEGNLVPLVILPWGEA